MTDGKRTHLMNIGRLEFENKLKNKLEYCLLNYMSKQKFDFFLSLKSHSHNMEKYYQVYLILQWTVLKEKIGLAPKSFYIYECILVPLFLILLPKVLNEMKRPCRSINNKKMFG